MFKTNKNKNSANSTKLMLYVMGALLVIGLISSRKSDSNHSDQSSSSTPIVTDTKQGETENQKASSTKTTAPVTNKNKNNESTKWTQACGHIYTGVKIYYGSDNNNFYVGKVLGGNERYTDPFTGEKFRGVKLLMKSGRTEWKKRSAICSDSNWIVKGDDPALKIAAWTNYDY